MSEQNDAQLAPSPSGECATPAGVQLGWSGKYRCGCASVVVSRKKDLPLACGEHGEVLAGMAHTYRRGPAKGPARGADATRASEPREPTIEPVIDILDALKKSLEESERRKKG